MQYHIWLLWIWWENFFSGEDHIKEVEYGLSDGNSSGFSLGPRNGVR